MSHKQAKQARAESAPIETPAASLEQQLKADRELREQGFVRDLQPLLKKWRVKMIPTFTFEGTQIAASGIKIVAE